MQEILEMQPEKVSSRGGWTRAEENRGSKLQYASVYTISHAVRISGEATEDPLKLEFLSSFRCKCWTLNVILFHNSSDYLTNTWWSMKTIKTWMFLRSRPRVKTSPRVIDQSHRRRWTYAAISSVLSSKILPLLNVYRNANDFASRVMQLYDSLRILYSANESLNAITSVLLFTCIFVLVYGSKIVVFSFTGNRRDMGTSELVGLFVYCVNLCHICSIIAWD